MTSRPRVTPRTDVKMRLFSDAAGFCQNPECLQALFPDQDIHMHVAHIAHIVAASDSGPRADASMDTELRSAYDNLLLLCPTCHVAVDKAPERYPSDRLVQWKRDRVAKITRTFGVECYRCREDARKAIEPLMEENFSIFRNYGPNNEYRLDPESELARVWKRKVLSRILPNNRRVLLILDKNRAMLSSAERQVLEEFRQHVEEMEARHLGDASTVGRKFPQRMQEILVGGE